MKTSEICAMLADVESREQVRICLAVESGSRAWGFPSADSDYDVRFIYVHRPDWYLSIDDGRDVIERPLTNMIDLSGWDLRKALKLFRKSNPPLLEWLQCPIVYAEHSGLANTLRGMLPRCFSAEASFHHYLHMARGNFREYLRGEVVRPKKYFYVLRPLLGMRWIEAGRGAVPIEFNRLLDATIPAPELRTAIDALMQAKAAGQELDQGPKIPIISDFIEQELARLETQQPQRSDAVLHTDELNALFRRTLSEVFPDVAVPGLT